MKEHKYWTDKIALTAMFIIAVVAVWNNTITPSTFIIVTTILCVADELVDIKEKLK